MDQDGKWELSPAYDLTFPFDVNNVWLRTQPILINGKNKDVTIEDFYAVADEFGIKKAKEIVLQVLNVVNTFLKLAERYELPEQKAKVIYRTIGRYLPD